MSNIFTVLAIIWSILASISPGSGSGGSGGSGVSAGTEQGNVGYTLPYKVQRQEVVTTTFGDSVIEGLRQGANVLFYNVPLTHDLMTRELDGYVTVSPEQPVLDYVSFSCGYIGFDNRISAESVTCGPMHSLDASDGETFLLTLDDIARLMDGRPTAVFAYTRP